MAQVYVLKVFASDVAGNGCSDRLLVTRNLPGDDPAKAGESYEKVSRVYEQKCNRGHDPSYRITLELRTAKGRKGQLVDSIKERRIYPAHH